MYVSLAAAAEAQVLNFLDRRPPEPRAQFNPEMVAGNQRTSVVPRCSQSPASPFRRTIRVFPKVVRSFSR